MRTFYLLIAAVLIISTASAKAEDQLTDYWQNGPNYKKDFVKDWDYSKIIKGIYPEKILKRVEICRANVKEWTSLSGSFNFGLPDKEDPGCGYVSVEASLEKVAAQKSRKGKENNFNYSLKAKGGFDEGGLAARVWKSVKPGVVAWDNEIVQSFGGESENEYLTALKFEFNF